MYNLYTFKGQNDIIFSLVVNIGNHFLISVTHAKLQKMTNDSKQLKRKGIQETAKIKLISKGKCYTTEMCNEEDEGIDF